MAEDRSRNTMEENLFDEGVTSSTTDQMSTDAEDTFQETSDSYSESEVSRRVANSMTILSDKLRDGTAVTLEDIASAVIFLHEQNMLLHEKLHAMIEKLNATLGEKTNLSESMDQSSQSKAMDQCDWFSLFSFPLTFVTFSDFDTYLANNPDKAMEFTTFLEKKFESNKRRQPRTTVRVVVSKLVEEDVFLLYCWVEERPKEGGRGNNPKPRFVNTKFAKCILRACQNVFYEGGKNISSEARSEVRHFFRTVSTTSKRYHGKSTPKKIDPSSAT